MYTLSRNPKSNCCDFSVIKNQLFACTKEQYLIDKSGSQRDHVVLALTENMPVQLHALDEESHVSLADTQAS